MPATMKTAGGSPSVGVLMTTPKTSAKMKARASGWSTAQLIPKKLCL